MISVVFAATSLIRATPESTLSSSDFPSQVASRRTRRLPPLRSHPRPTPRTSPRQSVPARCGKSRCPAPGHAFPPPTNLAAPTPSDPPPTARTRSTQFPFDCPPRPDPPRSASDVPAPSAPHLPATDMPSQALPIPIHPTPLAKGLADLLDLPELRRKLLNGAVLAGAAHGVAAAPGRVGMSPSSLSMDEPRWRGVLPVPKCGWVLVWEASLQFDVPPVADQNLDQAAKGGRPVRRAHPESHDLCA